MKVYIAAPYPIQGNVRAFRPLLERNEIQVTSSWFDDPNQSDKTATPEYLSVAA